jgi:transposase
MSKLGRPFKYGDVEKREVERLFGEGKNVKEASKITGIDHQVIYRWIRQEEVDSSRLVRKATKKSNKPPSELSQKIVELHEEGAMQADIAYVLGASQAYVSHVINRHEENVVKPRISERTKRLQNNTILALAYSGLGMSAREIADQIGVGESTVYRWLAED